MSTCFCSFHEVQKCRQTFLSLTFCSILSAGFGVLIPISADYSYFLLMRMAACRPVSIVGSAACTLVPFLIFLSLIVHSKPWLVYCFCACKLMLFTAAGYAIHSIYPYGNWLVWLMLQFPDICLIPLMLYLCIRRFTVTVTRRDVILSIPIAVLVGLINYLLISPFLADLMNLYETMGRYATHAGLDWCL